MTIAQIKKNMKHGDYNILQKLLKLSTESAARQKFLRGDKDALEGMIKIQENRSIFCDLHADEDCSCHDDLKEAINQKADRNHSHDWNEITGKPTEFPSTHHSHNVRDIEGLDDVLHTIDDIRNLSNQKLDRDGSNATGSLASTINNNHNHVNKAVLDTITSSKVNDWDNAASKAHNAVTLGSNATGLTITNQVLQFSNGYQLPTTIKVSEWDDAYLKRHTHGNKTVLDNLTQSVIDQAHVHSNKSVIDGITTQMVNNWNGSFANNHTHNNKSTLDGISSADVTNWDTAHANNHTHANKGILDAISAAYTVAEKNKLATIQPNAQVNVKADWNATSGDAEILNKPTSFIPASHNHAISDVAGLQSELDSKLETPHLNGFVHDVAYNSSLHTLTFYQRNEPNIVIDLPIEHLIKSVQLHGNDLVFTFEDGSNVTIPMNTLLVGVVKSVNGLAANSQGEVVLDITDIPGLQSALNGKANTSGYYPNLNVGYADYSSNWTQYDGTTHVSNPLYLMGYDASVAKWRYTLRDQLSVESSNNWGNNFTNTFGGVSGTSGIDYFYGYNSSTGNGHILTKTDFQNALGINTVLNLNLQQVTNHGNTTTNPLIVGNTRYANGSIFKDADFSFLTNQGEALKILTGGLLTSDNYVDASLIPTNGIYSKGKIHSSDTFVIGSSDSVLPNNSSYLGANSKAVFGNGTFSGGIAYGTAFYTTGDGRGHIQQQRFDGTNSSYALSLQPIADKVQIGAESSEHRGTTYKLEVFGQHISYGNESNYVATWGLSNGINQIVAGHELRFYNEYWKVGLKRGGSSDTLGYSFELNNLERVLIQPDSNIITLNFGSADLWYQGYLNSQTSLNLTWNDVLNNDSKTTGLPIFNRGGQQFIAKSQSSVGDNYFSFQNNLGVESHYVGLGSSNNDGFYFSTQQNNPYYFISGGNTIFQIRHDYAEMYRDLYVSNGSRIYTTNHLRSDEWAYAYNAGLMSKGEAFVNNIDANNISNGTELIAMESPNGTGNINFPEFGYGVFKREQTRSFTTDTYFGYAGEMWFRTHYNPSGAGSQIWRKVWDNVNLSDPATETWVTNNFISGSQLNNYLPLSGGTLTSGGKIASNGDITLSQVNFGGNATGIWWDDVNTGTGRISGIGALTSNGNFGYNYIGWGASPWDMNTSLAVNDTFIRWKNQDLALASQIPTNNNQLSNGAGYITSSALSGYAAQSWVNSQGFLTSASLPNVSNATITYQGTGAITGGGSHTVNQSGNSTYNFDLTNQTKNEISLGVNAYNSLSSKQDTLVAGSGISIVGNTISATNSGGGSGIERIFTDNSQQSGPTTSNMPLLFTSHEAYGKPEADHKDDEHGNLTMKVETGDVVRWHGSFDATFTDTPKVGTTYHLDIDGLRRHIYNIIFQNQGGGGTGGTVRFDKGIYEGDQINITVPRGQQINIQASTGIISSFGSEVQTHANLIWSTREQQWVLVSYS